MEIEDENVDDLVKEWIKYVETEEGAAEIERPQKRKRKGKKHQLFGNILLWLRKK